MPLNRREFTSRAVAGAALATAGPTLWRHLLAEPDRVVEARSSHDTLGRPDTLGIRLPAGFEARLLARSGNEVGSTGHVWHFAPDGGATFRRPDGGWIYCSNSELNDGAGGASSMSFTPTGDIEHATNIVTDTSRNCAGGPTPWGTWLSCEEIDDGRVWECDPSGVEPARLRAALGTFRHEAASVDPESGDVFLTEDRPDGRLYRFVPDTPGDLASGRLFAAAIDIAPETMAVDDTAAVTWIPTSADEPDRNPATSAFVGGEGSWIDGRRLIFTTKGDDRVWTLDVDADRLTLLHDCVARPDLPLGGVDNLTVHTPTGAIIIAEDKGDMQLCVLRATDRGLAVTAFCQVTGQDDSELTGPAFSPDGQRLYFSSQRGPDLRGLTYEVTGPFDRAFRDSIDRSAPTGPLRPAQRRGTTVAP